MSVPSPKALLWDWDNTLVDGWVGITHALNAVFTAFALPLWSVQTTRANVRGSLRDTFPAMFGADWPKARDLFYSTLQAEHLKHLVPMPGAEMALAVGAAWPQAVVSNKAGEFLRAEVAHLGWSARFTAVIGAGDATKDKPNPDPVHLSLQTIMPAGPEIWYVGDTAIDMQAARAAGCTAVLVGAAEHDGGVSAVAPDLHYGTLADLTAKLLALKSGTNS
jgi:phosphoglycolate phosphatase